MLNELIIASHNKGKIREIRSLLLPLGMTALSAFEAGVTEEPEETGETFAQNAVLKAEAVCAATGKPSLSDDSGFAVEALAGAPGIYSARWAGAGKDFTLAMTTVWEEWKRRAPASKAASFHCALALAVPGQQTRSFSGSVSGELTWPPRGNKGFGYDPMFVPEGYKQTFAEMEPEAKHAISHRARAFEKLLAHLESL
jgi:XTP/dITP diphosphohydrolase